MRADRPLIGAVLFLALGLGLIFGYCNGTTGMSVGFPFSGSSLQVAFTTYGPAVPGGLALVAIGLLLLLVALLAAIVGEIGRVGEVGPVWRSSRRAEREARLNRQQREDRVEANKEYPD
jgi:hypothetical protein